MQSSSSAAAAAPSHSDSTTSFEVFVSKPSFKFNCAHFVAYKGFRERLHGHNYRLSIRLLGSHTIAPDGYLLDFGCVKDIAAGICKEIHDHFICPTLSDVMDIRVEETHLANGLSKTVTLNCEDGSTFQFPYDDCVMLPIVHSTVEELAVYLWGRIVSEASAEYLLKLKIHTVDIIVAEAVGQEAVFRKAIPKDESSLLLNVPSFIRDGDIVPRPCLSSNKNKTKPQSCSECLARNNDMIAKLERIAKAVNEGRFQDGTATVDALDEL